MGCPLLPLHDQLSPPKERPQDKKNEIHISEPGEISFLASRPNLSMDNYNGAQEKIIGIAFGVSILANKSERRTELISVQQMNDQYLLLRDQNGNVIPFLEKWEFANCVEMNAWTSLCQISPDLPIKSQEVMLPCRDCQAC